MFILKVLAIWCVCAGACVLLSCSAADNDSLILGIKALWLLQNHLKFNAKADSFVKLINIFLFTLMISNHSKQQQQKRERIAISSLQVFNFNQGEKCVNWTEKYFFLYMEKERNAN